MKKIHKLVLKAYVGPLLAIFCIVLFVLMLNFVWRYIDELTGKGLDVNTIIELFVCGTINMVPLGLPLAMLLSAIMTMGNLGENFELLAMKSAGMSLLRILKPMLVVVAMIAVGSFFISNNLVPYANKRMYDILFDIREQRQELKFQDGMFFNGLPDMSIRVGHQNDNTGLLTDVIIYDTRSNSGDMTTTLADSGYIRMSDDKAYLYVTLFNGRTYEHTRSSQWYDRNTMREHVFSRQDGTFPIEKVAMPEGDMSREFSESQTRNMVELEELMDSLQITIDRATMDTYQPLLKRQLFARDTTIVPNDSIRIDRSQYHAFNFYDSIPNMSMRDKAAVYETAARTARSAQGSYSFDEQSSKVALTQYYRAESEWHRKLTLPISIIVFFMIGAPLGAIIRKGGLGTPIVISVFFFVIYYVISLSGEKMTKEGTWDAIYGMWLPVFVLTPVAIYLTYKATNDTSLLDMDWYDVRIRKIRRYVSKRLPKWMKRNKKSKTNTKR
ncbi:MAG: LptF/LptG family permease [Alistipes sp.]|nr:LptF/LptG family permease [Alistipes sp.]MBR3827026.1 LptF/LptG family permease [Alistipes sp.]